MLTFINDCVARAISTWVEYGDACKDIRLGEMTKRHSGPHHQEMMNPSHKLDGHRDFSEQMIEAWI